MILTRDLRALFFWELTFASGGSAKFSDNEGVIWQSSCCSDCEYPSSSKAGRLYLATSVSMMRGVRAKRILNESREGSVKEEQMDVRVVWTKLVDEKTSWVSRQLLCHVMPR